MKFVCTLIGCGGLIAGAASQTFTMPLTTQGGLEFRGQAVFSSFVSDGSGGFKTTLDLTNLLDAGMANASDFRSATQIIHGIQFTMGTSTATTFTPGTGTGDYIHINGTTSVTDNGAGTCNTWGGSGSGSTFKLDDSGHVYTIVGGTYGTTGMFSNSNSSLNDGHDDPHLESTGEWVLDFKGGTVNANTAISAVTIYFNTDDSTSFSVPPSGTPEPFTLGLGAAGIALAVRRRLRTR